MWERLLLYSSLRWTQSSPVHYLEHSLDVASSFVQEYEFSIFELLVEDPPEGHALFQDVSLFTAVGTISASLSSIYDGTC